MRKHDPVTRGAGGRAGAGLALAGALLAGAPAAGAEALSGVIVPTGRQEYFVLGYDQHVWNMMQRVRTGEGGPAFDNGMNSVVSAVASADGQVVVYDHWEDGFEADPWAPVQTNTLVLGDGSATNGRACDYTNDPRIVCGTATQDVLFRGSPITFNSDRGLTGCTFGIRCTVPVNPRGIATRFDGGDRLLTSGGPLALIHNQFPPPYPQIGGSTEVLPRQAFTGATSYYIPAGEDRYAFGGPYQMFQYTAVNIVAFDDDTQVFINSPGGTGGTVSLTLDRGQHYTNCLTYEATAPFRCTGGAIDGVAATGLTINADTKISATGPIAILLFSGGDGTWATDFVPILPDLLHGNDYILPAPGDNPAVKGNRPLNVYIYNPDAVNAISVTASDRTPRTSTIALPANSTRDYRAAVGEVPANSTVRLTSNRSFWGLALHDHLQSGVDWGYSWLATDFLTRAYTASFSPGVNDPATNSTPANRIALGGVYTGNTPGTDPDCTVPPAGPGVCDTVNRSPLFVSASLDNTLVKVDFDNDGLFDYVDTDSDDYPNNGVGDDGTCDPAPASPWNLPGLTSCLYRIDALQSLRVYDYKDYDNTGTRIQATKPIAVAYGQDTDQADGGDPILDTGYTVYPLSQRFLDPVLVVGKAASPTVVSGATGGPVTFTITVRSYAFTPITGLTVTDLLPLGLSAADYVAGSTLVTYPDLSQGTADPTTSVEGSPGRTRLAWALSPNSLGADQTLTIRFQVNVPPGGATTFSNETFATGVYAGRTFAAIGAAEVVRTSVSLTKLATDDGSPEPGDVLTYTLLAANNGSVAETTVRITDAIPPGTTYVAGSATTAAPFAVTYDALQNAVVWTAASFGAGQSATLTFQVRINADTPVGEVVPNRGIFESNETPTFFSNETQTVVVGPALVETKTIVGGVPSVLHPLEVVPFEIQVRNTGAGTASALRVTDALVLSRTTYVPGTMQYSVNGAAFSALTDAADADPGTLTGTTVDLLLPSLGPAADVRFRFQAQVDAGTGGQVMNNQATVSATQVGTADTNLVQVPIVGNATVTGRVFLDANSNGVLDGGETGIPNVTVRVTDSTGVTQLATTDATGAYSVVVAAGATTLDVDETDPDMPLDAVLTTANDPQSLTAVASSTVASGNVGYALPPLTIAKTSNAGGTALPGQTITYTVSVTNNTTTTQTGITLTDAVPAGTSYVAGTAQLTTTAGIRATEYSIGSGFTGTSYTLVLNQPLRPDYFVIIKGSDGDGGTGNRTPAQDYVSLTGDGHASGSGTGDLAGSGGLDRLTLTRGASAAGTSWVGVVTVVECIANCATDGFRLLDVQRVTHGAANTSGTDASAVAWTDLSRVMLMGGVNGAGCDTLDAQQADHKSCHARLTPSGTSTISWARNAVGMTSLETATSTVMVLQWGTAWTVQRTQVVNGNNGGGGINAAGEYNTAAVASVARANTWVWGAGYTAQAGAGNSAEGVALTLGNGVTQNANETLIAAGVHYANAGVNFDLYALTHPALTNSYQFKTNGSSGTAIVNLTVPANAGERAAVFSNSCASNATNTFPVSLVSARYTTNTNVALERRRTDANYAGWFQGLNFSGFTGNSTFACDDTLATCTQPVTGADVITPANSYRLPAGATLTLTYQVVVDAEPAPGLLSIDNTATVSTTQNPTPRSRTVSDALVRPRVDVEPNNAGYAAAGTTITFRHTVTNTGTRSDAYALTVTGERGWRVDLVDPDTGVVIASDTNADGTWDAGTLSPSTGTLAPGGSREYQLRVWVPAGTPAGVQDTVRLRATSGITATVWDDAKDEITVLSSTLGSVIVTPDNSGVVQAGSYTAYSHRVINNQAFPDTFDLRAPGLTSGTGVDSSQGWTNTIHWDTNGDGVYTPGTDLQILNTAQLAPGASQLIFVVVNAPGGTAAGTRDVSHITAFSRVNPDVFGAATDTSTVVTTPRHDLSGGGSRVVAAGDTAVFPGTIVNLGSALERFELTLTPASLYGPDGDGLPHPTELWVDTNADGVPDTLVAADTQGDGTWDVLPPGAWDQDGNGLPDVPVGGGGSFAYELRRPISLQQKVQRDFVTLSTRSITSPATDPDNVTATWVFAAATRAGIKGLRVGEGEVAFATSTQSGTAWFLLHQTDDPTGASGREPLHDQPVASPVPDSITPVLYTVRTRPVEKPYLVIEERETDGDTVWVGPFAAGDARLARFLSEVERRLDAAGVPEEPVRWLKGHRRARLERGRAASAAAGDARSRAATAAAAGLLARRPSGPGAGVKIEVWGEGPVRIPANDLLAAGLPAAGPGAPVRLTHLGRPATFAWEPLPGGGFALAFEARALATDYSDRNVYLLTAGTAFPHASVPLTRSSEPEATGFQRAERQQLYVPSLPAGADPWQWDVLFSGEAWPNPAYDPAAGDFDLPRLAPGAAGPAAVRLRVVGYTRHRHSLTATVNGFAVGSLSFDGAGPALLTGTVPAEALRAAGNRLEIAYQGTALADSPEGDAFAYVDFLDVAAPRSAAPAADFALAPWNPTLPSLRGVEYLVVTHPLFRAQADRIASEKARAGLASAVVETTAAYDRFSAGFVEPRAIQALVRFAARASRSLRYVLLVGDDSFDPLDHSGRGVPSLVPSLFSRDSGWGLVPSENLFADTDGDGRPDVAIGRLPVRTTADAEAAADKIASQATALLALGDAHLAVADNSTPSDAPFRDDAQRSLALLPSGSSLAWADVAEGPAAARAGILAAWQAGVLGTHYFGHGGLTEWADEQVLTVDDVSTLGAGWKPTALFTWACLSQYNLGVDGPSLNEALVLQPGGGALASFGPAGITPPAGQAPLAERVYAELRVPGTSLGEAIRRAKAAVVLSSPAAREVVDGFNLFGDPALVLPHPPVVPR